MEEGENKHATGGRCSETRAPVSKFTCGLFDNPTLQHLQKEGASSFHKAWLTAEKLAEETIVLLKNENKVLPLAKREPSYRRHGATGENCASSRGHGMDMDMQKMSSHQRAGCRF